MVIKKRNQAPIEQLISQGKTVLLVDQIQDPGNLGTMIRTADAAGIDAIIMGKGTVDQYSGKVTRSTQGSIFHIPIYEDELKNIIPMLKESGWTVFGTSLKDATDYRKVRFPPSQKNALLIGNEGEGVQEELLHIVDTKIKIPIWGKAESLNAAIATGILLYHVQGEMKEVE
jgi:TrmH family RNA methyltransferase